MKTLLFFAFVFFNLLPTFSQSTSEEVFLDSVDLKFLSIIKAQKELTIDHIDEHGFEVYGPKGTRKWLESLGAHPLIEINDEIKRIGDYPSSRDINNALKELHRKNPSIVKLIDLGKSVRGVELLAVKISDNAKEDEREPEFKYIGNMHGNEIVGREMLVALATHLVDAYEAKDPRITELVNSTEIFILPSMNPDGADKKRRGNANRVDLNRNFPDFSTRDNRDEIGRRQPEVAAIMQWQYKRNFSLSANFHGGTKVVNYPWDTAKDPAPLTGLIKALSKRYASTTPGFYNSTRYEGGIVNGNSWYEVNGGMQDWSYFYHNDLQVTVELSHSKWPRYAQIPQFFSDNKEALISYIEAIHQGINLYLPDVSQVELLDDRGKSLGSFGVKNDQFHKVLPAGDYTVKYVDPITSKIQTLHKSVTPL